MELIVDMPGGASPAYAYTGGKPFDAALPCIVFIHGALNDHSVWTLLARWFAHHGHAVLAVDLPGHGRSAGRPLPSVEALADWTLALIDAAGLSGVSDAAGLRGVSGVPGAASAAGGNGQVALVGHSMGSLIALEAAARAPRRVSRLVMVGTAYPMKVSDALLETARVDPLRAIDMVNAFSHSGLAAKPSYPGPGSWLHGADRALMRRMQAGQPAVNLFHHDFGVCNAYAGGMEAAARVRCPSHLVLGEHDRMTTPKQARDIARALAAQVHEVPAGHTLMAEAPEATLAALRLALG